MLKDYFNLLCGVIFTDMNPSLLINILQYTICTVGTNSLNPIVMLIS